MVVETELTDDEVDRIFRALADATRRDIVRRTLTAQPSISELAEYYAMSFAAVQKHVVVLEKADLITKRTQGRTTLVTANPVAIARAKGLLDKYEQLWHSRVTQLDSLLAQESP
ncbi:helix-turn-helix domain-containing protein [Demequina sp.]|uniref:ArsR/SmtB family transcription factor n=1 Tax=Demequina sp. TaxID=2050685 RepID=UPI0025C61168|nr:helix-turn-helix domain-containing protein [Demequina sp.]